MMYSLCKICNCEDDIDYLHPVYDGKSQKNVLICEKCRENLFSDRERLNPEDADKSFIMDKNRQKICIDTALSCYANCLTSHIPEEMKKIFGICDSPNTANK